MLMKLSKRLAAALIVLCMLLTVMPASAAKIKISDNESLVLPTDGSSVSITCTGTGNANDCLGLVINTASATALGIDIADVQTRTTVEGTGYDGLLLSGKFAVKSYAYDPALKDEKDKILRYGEVTEFEFKNLEVVAVRGGGKNETTGLYTTVVLEVKCDELVEAMVTGTVKKLAEGKITGEETEAVTFTEADFVTLTADEQAALIGGTNRFTNSVYNGHDFVATGGSGYNITNLTAKAGEDYSAVISLDTGIFPEGTIFISSNMINANGATKSNDWGYYAFSKTSVPSGLFISQASGEYAVYALKTGYSSSSKTSRYVKVQINGSEYNFEHDNMPESLASGKNFYWENEKTGKTVTLTKDKLFSFQIDCANLSYSRAAGIALVPVADTDELDAATDWRIWLTDNMPQEDFDALHDATTVSYIAPDPVSATVSVNGTDYEVSSVDAETVSEVYPELADFDGYAVENVTVLDALVKAGVVTAANTSTYKTMLTVKLNGMELYGDFGKWLLSGGEVITATPITTIDKTNFHPVNIGPLYSNVGGVSSDIKLVLSSSNFSTSVLSFAYQLNEDKTGSDKTGYDRNSYVKEALNGARVNGIAKSTKAASTTVNDEIVTIPIGSKVYFENALIGDAVYSDTDGLIVKSVTFKDSVNAEFCTKLATDEYIHNPYVITRGYAWEDAWITNSNTTDKVNARYIATNGKWQIYTDGFRMITVVKYTVDGEGKLASVVSITPVELMFNTPYSLELKDNERAYVWGYSVIDGTTMVPLTDVIANPVE